MSQNTIKSPEASHKASVYLSRLHKIALTISICLVVAGVIATLIAPPDAATRAPMASPGIATLTTLEAAPLLTVEREDLPRLKLEPRGITVAEMRQILAYDLEHVQTGGVVPRVFLASIPEGLADVPETEIRKGLFYKSVLPLVLQVNNEIREKRERLKTLAKIIKSGEKPSAVDRLWLAAMSERYNVERNDIASLLIKVDVVPPSLALAQAAKESGWGSSRFTREGNALFGQWTFAKGNLVPSDRDEGKTHMVKRFDSLIDSVRAYVRNLNTHRAYRDYRKLRAELKRKDKPMDGRILAGTLRHYSELGMEYVNAIRSMIRFDRLNRFDDARLDAENVDPAA